jgi:hypothetical protein
MREYIVPIYDDSSNHDEIFVGYIRENAQEIVRCGECKYREMFTPTWSYCPHLEWTVTDSFFCSDGERNE